MSANRMTLSTQSVVLILVVGSLALGVVYLGSRGGSDGIEETIDTGTEPTVIEEHKPQDEALPEETDEPDTPVEEPSVSLNETVAPPVEEEEPCGVGVERITLNSDLVYAGEPVEATVLLRNGGSTECLYELDVNIAGEYNVSREVRLSPGEVEEVTVMITRDNEGGYTISAGGENVTFYAFLANFIVTDLEIYPETISPGETVTVSAKLFNPNHVETTQSIQVRIGDDVLDREITLDPQHFGDVVVETTLIQQMSYFVRIGNQTGYIHVGEQGGEPPQPQEDDDTPWPEPWVWYEPDLLTDGFTSLLPPEASPVRLSLPASIEDIFFDWESGLAGYGMHAGGHVEGLNHVWIEVRTGVPIRSWGDGVVTSIRESGGSHPGVYSIIIDYGQGLEGTHMDIMTPFVEVGDNVSRGDPVGDGMSFVSGRQSAEFRLMDKWRTDGEYFGEGSAVSPYDYLIEEERVALVEAYKVHTVDKYGRTPRITPYFNAYQPYLTNKLLLHIGNEGNLTGEWLLISSEWENGYPNDIITIIEAENPWYTGNVILSADYTDMHAEGYKLQGTFEVDYERGRITIFNDNGKLYFGIFEIDESGDRARLRIQYQTFSYPETFTEDALVYIERTNMIMAFDAFSLGVLDEAPP